MTTTRKTAPAGTAPSGMSVAQEIRARALAAAALVARRSADDALAAADRFADYIEKGR